MRKTAQTTEGHDEDLATIDDTEHFENEADHMVAKARWTKAKMRGRKKTVRT